MDVLGQIMFALGVILVAVAGGAVLTIWLIFRAVCAVIEEAMW